jgi:exopolyphosphatase/guanosine-5'-triphosphate,3'-diphosphate pyrophosphatase
VQSLPLGAARLAREHLPTQPGGEQAVRGLRRAVRTQLAQDARAVLRWGSADRAVATSKTFRSLARICGAAPSDQGPFVRRDLARDTLAGWLPKLVEMPLDEIAALPGVSANRAHQVVPGAFVADAVMELFGLSQLEICPWALREGVILERLDAMRPA